ncbi:GntR family transcriptional regulator [Brenneria goodwinii]|uniref:GntR family transcriptional regulator n=1 Tax=Brenneria goodwinii TaxID=1109412 RepID=A0A0G4JXD1_9GAMM|nr:DoxX family protein [Brenneria goodwinii]ATA23112.1 GntR family transcriptional regulator [Brenneria goodwinii]MCG8158838.1 DoxX family protein [Brenneria goodwinii]MCG8163443.1 DoxX family protein [Brenneria goodwinii]MCG8167967.1 DoxX family protein [Brenneria goodwinii]MCG8172634.1 DoxX family protein [Brenneria goodwinii]
MLDSINRVFDKPDFGKLLLRLSFSILMLFHGWHKLHGGIGAIEGMLTSSGLPAFIAYGVFVGEIITPVLMILGIFTRPSALIFSLTMVAATYLSTPNLFLLTKTGAWIAEPAAVFFFAGLAIAFLGSGKYSVMSNPRLR